MATFSPTAGAADPPLGSVRVSVPDTVTGSPASTELPVTVEVRAVVQVSEATVTSTFPVATAGNTVDTVVLAEYVPAVSVTGRDVATPSALVGAVATCTGSAVPTLRNHATLSPFTATP